MATDLAKFILRGSLVVVVWVMVWGLVRPASPGLRVVRAALLVACLLVVLLALRFAGG
ncbi:MAG: hypothetical protein QHH07_08215 [Sedimentisphaerales bacterium]|nr:hypothetical protein [Sedimentisphaerales bacterium]